MTGANRSADGNLVRLDLLVVERSDEALIQ